MHGEKNNSHTSKIIDIHAHILPQLDDGSRSMDESRLLLQEAYSQGIRKIIATPHYINGHSRAASDAIREYAAKMQEAAQEIAPDFGIFPGQEILYFSGILDALESETVLTLADTKYVLIEFPVNITFGEVFQAVRSLVFARYFPVLAHIERYCCLRQHGRVEELIHAGAWMQMNYQSLENMRHFGERAWCRRMVLDGKIHFLGTDMHRMDYRPPQIRTVLKWMEKKGGRDFLTQLTWGNPVTLLSGELLP